GDAHDDRAAQLDAALLEATGAFDADYYLANNPDVARAGIDPLLHFCRHGWKELRNPSPDFDVWWYWASYLDPATETINPLVHQAIFSTAHPLPGKPVPRPFAESSALRPDARRICLFAAYDPDGLVDDAVIRYVRELSRHADVYYLADCAMARELVGWKAIGACDDLLQVNASCYLVRELDGVFAKLDRTACDWWGLQATKGIAATRHVESNRFGEKIAIDRVRESLLPAFEL